MHEDRLSAEPVLATMVIRMKRHGSFVEDPSWIGYPEHGQSWR